MYVIMYTKSHFENTIRQLKFKENKNKNKMCKIFVKIVCDCCLMPNEQCVSYIIAGTSYIN
jgi:hypothetical protein